MVVVLGAAVASADVTVTQSSEAPIADRAICQSDVVEHSTVIGVGSGGQALAAWLDQRYPNGPETIVVARVDGGGALLDPVGIPIGTGGQSIALDTAVGFDGSRYLVTWSAGSGCYGVRVGTDGSVADTTPITITSTGEAAAAVGTAGQFAVAWRHGDQVLVERIADDGSLLDTSPLLMGSGAFVKEGPRGASDGTNYAFVWSGNGIQAARIGTTGTVAAPGQVDLVPSIVGYQATPAIVYSGSEYFVAWNTGGMQHARVSTSLVMQGSAVYSGGMADPPAVAFDGTRYTVADEFGVTQGSGHVELFRVSTANADISNTSATLPGATAFADANLAYTGAQLLLGYTINGGFYDVVVAADGSVTPANAVLVSHTYNDQVKPAVAFDGAASYLTAWVDTRDPDLATAIYAARVGDAGGQDGSGVLVGHVMAGKLGFVALGRPRSAGSTSLAVWNDPETGDIRAARIDNNATVLDAGGVTLATTGVDAFGPIDVACTAATCLVVWTDPNFNVQAVRIGLDGTRIDATPLALGTGLTPRVAASDSAFLVLDGGGGALVPEQGAPQPLQLPASAGAGGFDAEWDGSHFTVIYTQQSAQQIQLFATLVDATGKVVGTPSLLATTTDTMYVTLAYDGSQMLATWWPLLSLSTNSVSIARIASDGSVLDPDGVTAATGPGVYAVGGGAHRIVLLRQVPQAIGLRTMMSFVSLDGTGSGGGGGGPGGSGGGCCRTDRGGSGAAVLAIVVVGLVRRRRRR